MLNRLLDLLRAGGTRRVAGLARELDTTPELVEVMLEDLCQKGYLRQVVGGCGEKCASCSMSGLCAAGSDDRLWVLTEPNQSGSGVA